MHPKEWIGEVSRPRNSGRWRWILLRPDARSAFGYRSIVPISANLPESGTDRYIHFSYKKALLNRAVIIRLDELIILIWRSLHRRFDLTDSIALLQYLDQPNEWRNTDYLDRSLVGYFPTFPRPIWLAQSALTCHSRSPNVEATRPVIRIFCGEFRPVLGEAVLDAGWAVEVLGVGIVGWMVWFGALGGVAQSLAVVAYRWVAVLLVQSLYFSASSRPKHRLFCLLSSRHRKYRYLCPLKTFISYQLLGTTILLVFLEGVRK